MAAEGLPLKYIRWAAASFAAIGLWVAGLLEVEQAGVAPWAVMSTLIPRVRETRTYAVLEEVKLSSALPV